jgi:hypothetical protein
MLGETWAVVRVPLETAWANAAAPGSDATRFGVLKASGYKAEAEPVTAAKSFRFSCNASGAAYRPQLFPAVFQSLRQIDKRFSRRAERGRSLPWETYAVPLCLLDGKVVKKKVFRVR